MKIKSSVTKKYFIIGILFFSLTLTVFVIFTKFMLDDAAKLKTTVEEVAFKQAEDKGTIEVSKLFTDTEEERNKLKQYVLTEDTLIDFVSQLEATAGKMGLDFMTQGILPKTGKKNSRFSSVSINVGFSGDREQVMSMLKVIETLPYHGEVSQVSVMSRGNTWETSVLMELTIIAYD